MPTVPLKPLMGLFVAVQRRRMPPSLAVAADQPAIGMLFVSHDLDAVTAIVDRVAVMRSGELLECGPVDEVMSTPRHPYTRSLLDARPVAIGRSETARATTELTDVCLEYARGRHRHRVVHEVSLNVPQGAALGIVGESGSGKSTLARAIMGMLTPASGQVTVLGHDPADRGRRVAFARECQFVFQDTSGSLNPRRTIAQALANRSRFMDVTRRCPCTGAGADCPTASGTCVDAGVHRSRPGQAAG